MGLVGIGISRTSAHGSDYLPLQFGSCLLFLLIGRFSKFYDQEYSERVIRINAFLTTANAILTMIWGTATSRQFEELLFHLSETHSYLKPHSENIRNNLNLYTAIGIMLTYIIIGLEFSRICHIIDRADENQYSRCSIWILLDKCSVSGVSYPCGYRLFVISFHFESDVDAIEDNSFKCERDWQKIWKWPFWSGRNSQRVCRISVQHLYRIHTLLEQLPIGQRYFLCSGIIVVCEIFQNSELVF